MRIEQDFFVARAPETVFDYLTDPGNLADWQTSKTSVEQITDGPPRHGTRVRDRTRQPGDGTRVRFRAEGELSGAMRLLGPGTATLVARQFRGSHEHLR